MPNPVSKSEDRAADHQPARQPGWAGRVIDLKLLLLIVAIGIPLLLYCIVASAR